MDMLVERLVDDDLGDKLLLLRLKQSRFGSVSVEKITGILANLERVPALLNLRLDVPGRYARYNGKLLPRDEYEQIEEQHQGELLPSVLPLNQKVAFLSALRHTSATAAGASARYDLDIYMASPIFKCSRAGPAPRCVGRLPRRRG